MNDDPFPAQDPDTEKWGYIDKSGEWVIEPEYEQACMFSDGLGLVYSEDKGAGFVNAQGELVVSGYIAATSFSDGVAFVSGKLDDEKNGIKHNNRYAAIDKNGAWALDSAKSSTETDRYCYKQPIFFHDGLGLRRASKTARRSTSTARAVESAQRELRSRRRRREHCRRAASSTTGTPLWSCRAYDGWADMQAASGIGGTTAYGLIDKNGAPS